MDYEGSRFSGARFRRVVITAVICGSVVVLALVAAKTISVSRDDSFLALVGDSFSRLFMPQDPFSETEVFSINREDDVRADPEPAESFAVREIDTPEGSDQPFREEAHQAEKQLPVCPFSGGAMSVQRLRINEIAWMGSVGDPNGEWIEIFNPTSEAIPLFGWSVRDKDEKFEILLETGEVGARGFTVMRRGTNYAGALSNDGAHLRLIDPDCNTHDEFAFGKGWPAGDNITKQTMERTEDGGAWYTSADIGGTPGAKNSSTPVREEAPPLIEESGSSTPPVSTTSTSPQRHILIAEVQITGGPGASDNDMIVLYNPNDREADIGGWKLKKRTKSGTEYSVKTFSPGAKIAAYGTFMWANAKSGFAESVGAHASSVQILSDHTSIALIDASGRTVDAVAWGAGHANPFIEGEAYPENPGAGQRLSRKSAGTGLEDTDNNRDDFTIR